MLVRDPRFIREFRENHCVEVFVEHLPTKKKYGFFRFSLEALLNSFSSHYRKKLWRRKDQGKFGYPYQES